ncbi:unnamed protein product [Penicillium roqueforti FM164]|uniref:Genomic scaffold, ProqFM164S01 n=1 Tax=Penicillium roqueforti (strain FM164) TaxID=1365484 RepID=W6Q0J2_PENRF|nr:unnamed protein product [Penicillium roqueforti FM164]
MGAVSRNHGLERDWSGKGEEGGEASSLQTAGLVRKEVFPWGIFVESTFLQKLNCNCNCCIVAIRCARVRARRLNCLSTYRISIHPPNASGLRDSKEDPVRSRMVTYYVPTLESGHSDQSATVCLVFASRQDKKRKTSKQAVLSG